MLMSTIKLLPYQFFLLKKDILKTAKNVTHKAGCDNVSIGSLNFFPTQFIFKCLHLLFGNSFLDSLCSFYVFIDEACFCISPLTFTLSKNCSVSTDAAFPVAMLYNLSLSAWSNRFIVVHRRSITLCDSVYLSP